MSPGSMSSCVSTWPKAPVEPTARLIAAVAALVGSSTMTMPSPGAVHETERDHSTAGALARR